MTDGERPAQDDPETDQPPHPPWRVIIVRLIVGTIYNCYLNARYRLRRWRR